MTRNISVGAQFDAILFAAAPDVLLAQVDLAWRAVLDTDFAERATVLARETAAADPDIIALQEVARLFVRDAGAADEELLIDYLDVLTAELSRMGASYRQLSACQAADVSLPASRGSRVRLTIRNVILARDGVSAIGAGAACYGRNLSVRAGGAGGAPITVLRGWAAADVRRGGRDVRIINTHFETQPHPAIQRAQAEELLRTLEGTSGPVILAGDLNSDALGGDTPTYRFLLEAGFTDAWRAVREDEGYTCCHSPDLRSPHARFTKRIDHVLVRGALEVRGAELVGAGPESRTRGGLWASDHAGVVVDLAIVGDRGRGAA